MHLFTEEDVESILDSSIKPFVPGTTVVKKPNNIIKVWRIQSTKRKNNNENKAFKYSDLK